MSAALMLACAGCPSTTLWLDDAHDAGTLPGRVTPPQDAATSAPPAATTTAIIPPPPTPAADGGSSATPAMPAADGGKPAPPPMAAGGAGAPAPDIDAGITPTDDALPRPTRMPNVTGTCPKLGSGGRYNFRDTTGRTLSVQIYASPDAKTKPAPGGPLILYFHAIGGTPSEVASSFTQASIDAVVAQGGVVASFESSVCVTCLLDDQQIIWYEQDTPVVDQVVACAIAQANIDTRHVHAIGFSAGAMYSIYLALARSAYVASVISYSGGLNEPQLMPQDPSNHVAALLAYGRPDLDTVVLNFPEQSIAWYDKYHPLSYFSLMCDHGGGHMVPSELPPLALRFFSDHPYRVSPEPYATSIPSAYPAYCHDAPPNR